MSSGTPFALRGTFVHAPDFGILEVLQDTVCIVSGHRSGGKILAMVPGTEADTKMQELGLQITVHKIPVSHLTAPLDWYFPYHVASIHSLTSGEFWAKS